MFKKLKQIELSSNQFSDKSIALATRYADKIMNKIDKRDIDTSLNENIATDYSDTLLEFINAYSELVEPYADFARKTTVPINWPYFLYKKLTNKYDSNVLFHPGVHFFVALQGGGKSTLAYDLISEILVKTGKSSYVNAHFEIPEYDPVTKQYFCYFQYFKLMDFFDMSVREETSKIEVSQLKRFNRNFDTIVLDEWLTEMNHRLNKTKDYNNIFMALITMIAHMRHQKMQRIYVLSQIDNTDIQLLSMFKYVHEVQIDLDVTYADWIDTGMMAKHIKGWHIYTFGVKRNRKKMTTDKVLIKKQYRKATADFTYFDSLAMSHKYNMLKEDEINFIKE